MPAPDAGGTQATRAESKRTESKHAESKRAEVKNEGAKKRLRRFRPAYAVAAASLFAIEALIALYGAGFVRHTLGDVLATALVYVGLRMIADIRPGQAAAVAFVFSAGVEAAQAANLLERLGLEGSALARLVLGTTFAWGDMAAYALGAAGAWGADRLAARLRGRMTPKRRSLPAS